MALDDPGFDALYTSLECDKNLQRKLLLNRRARAATEALRDEEYWAYWARQPLSGEGTPP